MGRRRTALASSAFDPPGRSDVPGKGNRTSAEKGARKRGKRERRRRSR